MHNYSVYFYISYTCMLAVVYFSVGRRRNLILFHFLKVAYRLGKKQMIGHEIMSHY